MEEKIVNKKGINDYKEQNESIEKNNETEIFKSKNRCINKNTIYNAYKENNLKCNAGITIIALAVTILIIIILAGITINAVLGDNGLLRQAQDVKDMAEGTTLETGEKMNKVLQEYMNVMAEDEGGEITEPEKDTTPPTVVITTGKITSNSIEISVVANDQESGLASENAYVYYLNGAEYTRGNSSNCTFTGLTADTMYTIKVEVINGVGIKGENSTTINTTSLTVENLRGEKFETTTPIMDESGDTVWIPGGFEIAEDSAIDADDGVVIQDSKGNQFVWIPVKDETKFQRYGGYYNGTISALSYFVEPYNGYSDETSEYNVMVSSIKKYNGFYIGRFEAGTTNSNRNEESGISDIVIIKKNVYVYNFIKWRNDINDEIGGATELSKKFASVNGYTTVSSCLTYSILWDAVMNFIDPAYSTNNCNSTSFVRDSSGKGWYSQNVPTKTGYYSVNNIYDLAGNVGEWTMEVYSSNGYYPVLRGGSYTDTGNKSPASTRNYTNHYITSQEYGFRISLYIK